MMTHRGFKLCSAHTHRKHLSGRILGLAMILICGIGLVACGASDLQEAIDDFNQEPDAEPIRATIKTAVPLAHIAAVAMAAVDGHPTSEVTTATTCTTYPCPGLVTMHLDQQNLPFAVDDGSSIVVAGLWTSADSAVLTVTFPDWSAGVPTFPVDKISTFPVVASQRTPGYTIVFADIDINIASEPDDTIDLTDEAIQMEYERVEEADPIDAEVNLTMDAWVVNVTDAGTPYAFGDDRYEISGGGQYIGVRSSPSASAANVTQLGLAGITITDTCALNPTHGYAFMQEVDVSSGIGASFPVLATALFGFDDTCDGRAPVLLATGNFIAATGSTVPMNLNQP